jgi:hypothetical protein
LKLSQLLKALTALFFFSMAEAFAVWKVMVGARVAEKVVLGAGEDAGASRAFICCSVPYLIADRDSGDETRRGREGRRGRKIRQRPQKYNKPLEGGFRAGFSYNLNSDKSRYFCTCRF